MKTILVFIGGILTGVLLTVVVFFVMTKEDKLNDELAGLTMFPKKGECVTSKSELQIFQVVKPNMALAKSGVFPDDLMILLINHDGNSYYDDQKIKIPANKCARQVGTYQYTTAIGFDKTVPVVVIE